MPFRLALWSRRALVPAAACLSLCCLLLACSAPSSPEPKEPESERAHAGSGLYDKYCKLCHGENAEGYAADNANALAHPAFLATASDELLWTAIEKGRPGTAMAAFGERFGGPLADGDIGRIIAFLRNKQSGPSVDLPEGMVKGDAARAKPVYQAECADCHGAEGQGKTAPSLNNPLFLATASDAFIRYAIEHGRKGTPMPAFGERLSDQQIDDVTHLIRTWARNVPDAPVGERPPPPEQVVINPKGPAPEFSPLRDGRYVPADEVKKALDAGARMVLLDARPMSDWLRSHIPGAVPVPFYAGVDTIVKALPRDGTWIVSYCACPHAASGQVMDMLRAEGFDNTAVLDEGILVWTQRGYPVNFGVTP